MIKAVLLDLDGTVYEGTRLIPGTDEAIRVMREKGLKVVFCTNNSSKSRISIAKKLVGMGIPCGKEDVVSSGFIAIEYAKNLKESKICLSGSDEIRGEFVKNGISLCEPEECEILIIGMDIEFDYPKMTYAVRAALNAKKIIVCNKDRLFPTETGPKPGSGAIVGSILSAVDREEDLILGKPNTPMLEFISKTMGFEPEEMLMVGDTPSSDGAMAESYGSRFLLVSPERTVYDSIDELLSVQ